MIPAASRAPAGSPHLILTVLGTSIAAWIGVIALHGQLMTSPDARLMASMPAQLRQIIVYCGSTPDVTGPGFGPWIVGWTLMILAMMLPPALPLVRASERLVQGRSDRALVIALVLSAFVAIWLIAGGLLFALGSAFRAGLNALPQGVVVRPDLAAGFAAMAIGAFQFTPLKMACMDACRSPAGVMMVDWRDATPLRSAVRVGLRYGSICVGCCWAMMLLGLLVGTLMLPIMVFSALMMTLERMLPSVRPLIPLQAGFAIVVGLLLIAGTIPPAFF